MRGKWTRAISENLIFWGFLLAKLHPFNCNVLLHLPILLHSAVPISEIHIFVVVNFLSQVILVFFCFCGMEMCTNEVETKEK